MIGTFFSWNWKKITKLFTFFLIERMSMLWINESKIGCYLTLMIMKLRIGTDPNLKMDLEWKPQLSLIKKSELELNHILVIYKDQKPSPIFLKIEQEPTTYYVDVMN
jgi:hypothetical protein